MKELKLLEIELELLQDNIKRMKEKTAIQEAMDELEMEENNGVEISQKVLWKILKKAKDKEKQQIEKAFNAGVGLDGYWAKEKDYYKETFENNEPNF